MISMKKKNTVSISIRDDCVQSCRDTDGCVGIRLNINGCYLKNTIGPRSQPNTGYAGRLCTAIPDECPQSINMKTTKFVAHTRCMNRFSAHFLRNSNIEGNFSNRMWNFELKLHLKRSENGGFLKPLFKKLKTL